MVQMAKNGLKWLKYLKFKKKWLEMIKNGFNGSKELRWLGWQKMAR